MKQYRQYFGAGIAVAIISIAALSWQNDRTATSTSISPNSRSFSAPVAAQPDTSAPSTEVAATVKAQPSEPATPLEEKTISTQPVQEFADWTTRYTNASPETQKAILGEGIQLAKVRRETMHQLIVNDPKLALESTVPVAARQQLPSQVQSLLEERISGTGDLAKLAGTFVADTDSAALTRQIAFVQNRQFDAHTYGRRAELPSMTNVGVHGIAIGKDLAVLDRNTRPLEVGEPASAKPIVRVTLTPKSTSQNPIQTGVVPSIVDKSAVPILPTDLSSTDSVAVDNGNEIVLVSKQDADTYDTLAEGAQHYITAADGQAGSSGVVGRPTQAWTTGTKDLLVIRVDFSDSTGNNLTDDSAATQINGDSQQFIEENSFNQASIAIAPAVSGDSPDVTNVLRLPRTAQSYVSTNEDYALHNDARSAATTAGYNMANYDRILVVFNSIGFGWDGLGTLNGPYTWYNGVFNLRLVTHELGHNYGILHSNKWLVNDMNPISPNGYSDEYGESFDVMGRGGQLGDHFNQWQKSILHWIPDSAVQTVTSGGTYRLYRFDHAGANLSNKLAIKIVRDSAKDYWIGYKRATAWSDLDNGLNVLWGYNYIQDSDLLDMSPSGGADNNTALPLNTAFMDFDTSIWFKPVAQGGSGADEWMDVQVSFTGGPPGGAPTVTFTTPVYNYKYTIGQPLTFTGYAIDPDDGVKTGSAFSWKVERFENGVLSGTVHTSSGNTSLNYTVPTDADYPTTFLVSLTVTDASSQQTTITRLVSPAVLNVVIGTNTTGIPMVIDGISSKLGTSYSQRIAGQQMTISAAETAVNVNGIQHFTGWQHGGARTQTITVSETNATFVANYEAEGGHHADGSNFGLDWHSVGAGQFQYSPSNMNWTFSNGAGVASNGSGFTSSNPNAPEGTQVAFLQGSGSITQSISGLIPNVGYKLSFKAAQRNYGGSAQTWRVKLDGVVLGTYSQSSTSYQPYSVTFVPDDSGPFDLVFEGTNTTGDNTVFIDDISIESLGIRLLTGNGWRAEYYNNLNFSGYPALTRAEASIDYDSNDSIPGVNTNDITVRWSAEIEVTTQGSYTFYTTSDDGVRLRVANYLLINDWTGHAPLENSGSIYLMPGRHSIVLEFFQEYATGSANISWSGPGISKQLIPTTVVHQPRATEIGSGLKAEYFNNQNLSGTPVLTRTDAQVNYSDLQSIPGVNTDDISVRWSGYLELPTTGAYTIYTNTDDGVRLYFNGQQVINDWNGHPATENSYSLYMAAGRYEIAMEYYEGWGDAVAQLSWTGPSISKQLIPSSRLTPKGTGLKAEYFNNMTLSGAPVLTRQEGSVDYNDSQSIPGVNTDYISARWSGQIQVPVEGAYAFYTNSDDGVRLKVNGVQVINNWTYHGPTEDRATVHLIPGRKYDIEMEYFEYNWGAVAQLSWASQDISKQIIPAGYLYPPGTGLKADYFNNTSLSGSPALTRVEPIVDYNDAQSIPGVNSTYISTRRTGKLYIPESGDYTFYTNSDDGVKLWLNGTDVISNWTDHGATEDATEVYLLGGSVLDVNLEFYQGYGNGILQLKWEGPGISKDFIPAKVLTPAP